MYNLANHLILITVTALLGSTFTLPQEASQNDSP